MFVIWVDEFCNNGLHFFREVLSLYPVRSASYHKMEFIWPIIFVEFLRACGFDSGSCIPADSSLPMRRRISESQILTIPYTSLKSLVYWNDFILSKSMRMLLPNHCGAASTAHSLWTTFSDLRAFNQMTSLMHNFVSVGQNSVFTRFLRQPSQFTSKNFWNLLCRCGHARLHSPYWYCIGNHSTQHVFFGLWK